ncbi:hypothetical protein A1354_26680 [Pseudomonas asplenii]|nr:hypothetical protein [Pseudomonas asplenii]PNG42056.1 hypothetical protein A1354_26680 [Pseudomonas asplenii]
MEKDDVVDLASLEELKVELNWKRDVKERALRRALLVFLMACILLGMAGAYFTYSNPRFIVEQADNPWPISFVFMSVFAYVLAIYLMSLNSKRTFNSTAENVFVQPLSPMAWELKAFAEGAEPGAAINEGTFVERANVEIKQPVPSQPVQGAKLSTPFEVYINSVVHALDERINISEKKAKELLDSGKMYLFRGIIFYMLTIFLWQLLNHYWGYSHFILLGMVSTSLMFIVVEFLAAWFLKQYRSYVDSSIVYLSVRSAFNRYLLTYYAVNQFEAQPESLKVLVELLSNEIKWPTHKDMTSNDFNYMVESMGAVTDVLEKLKGVIGSKDKGGSAAG